MTIKLRCADRNVEMFVVLLDSHDDKEPDGRLWQCARFEFSGVKERLYAGRWFTGQIGRPDTWPKVIDMPDRTAKQLRAILNSHQTPEEIEELVSEWSRGGLTSWA